MPMNDETREVLRKVWEEREGNRTERIRRLEERFRACPGSLTDKDRLEWIAQMVRNPEIESAQHFETLINSLSFTQTSLANDELRHAWSDFVKQQFARDGSLDKSEWTARCDRVMAHCFEHSEKIAQATSVYEHILAEIIRGNPDYHEEAEPCLLKLFNFYNSLGITPRARELATLIGMWSDEGLIDPESYFDVLKQQTRLFYKELGELVDRDRTLAMERLKIEFGDTFDNLHPSTRNLVIDAELWSDGRMQNLEPSAGPLRWALSIESEFHHKVYGPNKEVLRGLFSEKERPKPEYTCGLGQIVILIKSGSNQMSRTMLEKKLPGWHRLLSVSGLVTMLERIGRDRKQIVHVSSKGTYTKESSSEFVRDVRKSGWVFEFLSSLSIKGEGSSS
jgi:hypothetical protein